MLLLKVSTDPVLTPRAALVLEWAPIPICEKALVVMNIKSADANAIRIVFIMVVFSVFIKVNR